MSALLGHNPIKYTSWKGNVVHQISSSIQKNAVSMATTTDFENYRRALPLKIYRREIVTNIPAATTNTRCVHSRISSSIDELNRPNGSLIRMIGNDNKGLENVIEIAVPNTKYETGTCTDKTTCIADNARKRVRSGGMNRKKFDPATGDYTYFANSKQYLTSRSKTYNQNAYHHVRHSDVLINPPTASQSKTNIYVPNGIIHCPKTQITSDNNVFYYYWVNATGAVGTNTQYTITIPIGYYDLGELNVAIHNAMFNNGHYIVNKITNSPVYLVNFAYNTETRQIELQLFSTSNYQTPLTYALPTGVLWSLVNDRVVTVQIPSTGIQSLLGFTSAYYPALSSGNVNNASATDVPYLNNVAHSIQPSNLTVSYKPNNARFAQQGGVSSSSMTDRKKYETIMNTATTFVAPFGKQVANALAYGVQEVTYTGKDKMGFPNTKTPTVCKWTGAVTCRDR